MDGYTIVVITRAEGRVPFRVGEILILAGGEFDREALDPGRKPSKWQIDPEEPGDTGVTWEVVPSTAEARVVCHRLGVRPSFPVAYLGELTPLGTLVADLAHDVLDRTSFA